MQHRLRQFDDMKVQLSAEAKRYWDLHTGDIEIGILVSGRFERFVNRVRPFLRLMLANAIKMAMQRSYREMLKSFPHRRFSWVLNFFSSSLLLKIFGGKEVEVPVRRFFSSLKEILRKGESVNSFLFHWILIGDFRNLPTENLPPSLKREVLAKVKNNLQSDRIKIHYRTAEGSMAVSLMEMLSQLAIKNKNSETTFFSIIDTDDVENIISFLEKEYSKSRVVLRSFKDCAASGARRGEGPTSAHSLYIR
jgi:hypothetical protein